MEATKNDTETELHPEKNENDIKGVKVVEVELRDIVEYDELLSLAGEFGRYQILLFFASCPFYVFGVFVYYSQLFITEVSPNHWCWIPELENLTALERRNLGVPKDNKSRFGYSQCEMYSVNWSDALTTLHYTSTPKPTWNTVPCQHGWEFNKSEIPYPTISSDLEWVCEKGSYQADAQAIFFLGSICGGFLIGWIADRFGRLPAAIISNMIGCAGGFATAFVHTFSQFAASRFVMGIAYDNCMMMAYLIVLEYVAPRYRTLMASLAFALFYSAAVTILPWVMLLCGHWKVIALVTSLPLILSLFAPFLIPESPRWLLSKGRVDDAINKVLHIGRINRKEIPPSIIEKYKSTVRESKETKSGFLEIFKRPLVAKMFILVCIEYMCCDLVFDGLVRSVGLLDFDFFISFSLMSFTEFPSMLLAAFIMDLTGRKWLTVVVMTFSSIFCILTLFSVGIRTVIFAVLARFAVNLSYNAAIQWAAEILPTCVRGTGVSIVHICGYVSVVLSPYIIYLKNYYYWLPLAVIAAIAGFGAVIAMGLPETATKSMPHTFDDAENLARNNKFWTVPCLEKRVKCNMACKTKVKISLQLVKTPLNVKQNTS